jgi:hypothetical protein
MMMCLPKLSEFLKSRISVELHGATVLEEIVTLRNSK